MTYRSIWPPQQRRAESNNQRRTGYMRDGDVTRRTAERCLRRSDDRWRTDRRPSVNPSANPCGMLTGMTAPVLYVIVCACPPAREVDQLVRLAKERGFDTCVLTTPLARRFLDVEELAALTGHPVRSEYKHPDEPDVLPSADALMVAPAR